MQILYYVLAVVHVLGCIALVASILLQKKSSQGLGTVAGMGNSGTYWDKNKGRSVEGKLEKYTKLLAVAIGILTIVLCLL